jgi:hypothetical protein
MVVPLLGEYLPVSIGRGICFNTEWFVRICMDEDGGTGDEVFQALKGLLLGVVPFPFMVNLGEVVEGSGDFHEVPDESSVKVAKPNELLNSSDVFGGAPVVYGLGLDGFHLKSLFQ